MVGLYRRLGKLITIYALIHGVFVLAGGIWEIRERFEVIDKIAARQDAKEADGSTGDSESAFFTDSLDLLTLQAKLLTSEPWAWAGVIQKAIYQMVLLLGCGAAIFIAANLMERTKFVAGAVDPESATA